MQMASPVWPSPGGVFGALSAEGGCPATLGALGHPALPPRLGWSLAGGNGTPPDPGLASANLGDQGPGWGWGHQEHVCPLSPV